MLTVDFFAALRAAATFFAGLPPGWAALIFTVHFSFTARAQVCGLIRYVPSSSPRRRGGGRSHKSCAFVGALTKISAGRSTRKGVRRIRKAAQRIRPAPRPRPPSLGLRPIHLEVLPSAKRSYGAKAPPARRSVGRFSAAVLSVPNIDFNRFLQKRSTCFAGASFHFRCRGEKAAGGAIRLRLFAAQICACASPSGREKAVDFDCLSC